MPDKQCFKFLLLIAVLLSGFRVRKLHIVLIANCCISHCDAHIFIFMYYSPNSYSVHLQHSSCKPEFSIREENSVDPESDAN